MDHLTYLPTKEFPTYSPTISPPTHSPIPKTEYFFGDEFVRLPDLGIDISKGLKAKLIAQTRKRITYANGDISKDRWHPWPDGAAIIPIGDDGDYVYISNSEENDGGGGVYGLYFDNQGNIVDYKALMTGTTWNCGFGVTPWNSFISCEEHAAGQCWQIDPKDERKPEMTKLGGAGGGQYESVAVDAQVHDAPVFYTTEDKSTGALRKFVAKHHGWEALHQEGDESFLKMRGDGTFRWTTNESKAKESAYKHYPNCEGIQYHEDKLYVMSKRKRILITLDLTKMTYETEPVGRKFYGEGVFSGGRNAGEPDHVHFGPTRRFMYFTEDFTPQPGVYGRYVDGTYFTMFQAIDGGIHSNEDESVGIALSPDNMVSR